MKVFVAASYSAQVDPATSLVFDDYAEWLEALLVQLEDMGYPVFCSLREDRYRINDRDPAAAIRQDLAAIERSDALLALLSTSTSAGVQTEVGYAVGLKKKVLLAHDPHAKLAYMNNALVSAGLASELLLPLEESMLRKAFVATSS